MVPSDFAPTARPALFLIVLLMTRPSRGGRCGLLEGSDGNGQCLVRFGGSGSWRAGGSGVHHDIGKASCRVNGTEATQWPISALNPSMIDAVVEILAVPVADIRTELPSNRTRITVMSVGSHPGGSDASHRFGRSKALLCRRHIAGLGKH
jgi:hypothetical protein